MSVGIEPGGGTLAGDRSSVPPDMVLPLRTVVGAGTADALLDECRVFGRRGVLVHGRSLVENGAWARLMAAGDPSDEILCWRHPGGEPTLDQLDALRAAARGHRAEWVAAVGGGSVLDVGKAAAGLLDAPHPAGVYHGGAAIEPSRIPFIAVPTTAGTGSEATMVAVLTDEPARVKKSIRHPSFMARLVMLDPRLLDGCPAAIVASAGMDALTQAIEAYISRKACPLTDAAAALAIPLIYDALPAVYGGDGGKAAALLQGSYLAGIALSGARLGVVHGLAHPLGVRYEVPHGTVCAVCLRPGLQFNRAAMGEKYAALAAMLGGDPLRQVHALTRSLNLDSPFRNRPLIDKEGIIEETLASGSTAANPRTVSAEDVSRLLEELFTP